MIELVEETLSEVRFSYERFLADRACHERIAEAGLLMAGVFASGGRVFSCGNGGSLCDAMHFAEECSGRFRLDRRPLPAVAIADSSHISCCANDFGWDTIFARFLEAHGRPGDLLFAISTSGSSSNVLEAARTAKSRGLAVVALTGKPDSELGRISDMELATPGGRFSDHAQEMHIIVIHTLVRIIERRLFPELA